MNKADTDDMRPVPAACPSCRRPIDDVFDLPLVEVTSVVEVEPPDRVIEHWMGERDVRERFVEAVASEPVRAYLDALRALFGQRVQPSALQPPWRRPGATSGFFVVPEPPGPTDRHPPWWAVIWTTRWHGERFRATVDVQLASGGANLGSAGGPVVIPVAPIARVEVEGFLDHAAPGGALPPKVTPRVTS